MAIYFANMSAQETAVLTEEMMLSGEVIDLSHISKPKIDKYSTGGVGDKTALVLAPLAMASGVVVPMMCGVEQEFVITTLEKLSAAPGFKSHMSIQHFVDQLARVGGAIAEQSAELAPADKIFYDLRLETGTIPSLPLITGSVLSKKLAEGAEGLVIDVKWGNGSFIKDLEQAKQLARSMTRVGRSMKRRCVALVTDMNQPLEAQAERLRDRLTALGHDVRLVDFPDYTNEELVEIFTGMAQGADYDAGPEVVAAVLAIVQSTPRGPTFGNARAVRNLLEGDKVKVTLRFRGREMAHQEFGLRQLERVKADLEELGQVEQMPKMEGRQMIMIIAPKKKH